MEQVEAHSALQRRVSICEYAPLELSALDSEALKRF